MYPIKPLDKAAAKRTLTALLSFDTDDAFISNTPPIIFFEQR
jgi:hypothetical protein